MSDVAVDTTEEPLPFVFRFTDKGNGEIGLEVGDDFELSPAWAKHANGIMAQIGLQMVHAGLQLLGHEAEYSKTLCALALRGIK